MSMVGKRVHAFRLWQRENDTRGGPGLPPGPPVLGNA